MDGTTRRAFVSSAAMALGGSSALLACSHQPDGASYEATASETWRTDGLRGSEGGPGHPVLHELVRLATLAPSSHNTQCWKFALETQAITILPDLSRRCPAVDPDDHHVFVSLGCAAENLVHAALAHGLMAEPRFDVGSGAIKVSLAPVAALASPFSRAIAMRQCTRSDYDGQPLADEELRLLERAGTSSGVRMLLVTERPVMERVLEYVVQASTAQISDAAFVRELKTWIRFNGTDAVRTRDGLFSKTSGNPEVPGWLGELAFGWLYKAASENEKIVRQIRSSAGVAVFIGEGADKAHWVEVGRAYERFALQATALGVRNAFLNQPVEVPGVRSPFAEAMGLAGRRPDLVVRFGRGPSMPRSLRRPVQTVLV